MRLQSVDYYSYGRNNAPSRNGLVMSIVENEKTRHYYQCEGNGSCENGGFCIETKAGEFDQQCVCSMPYYGSNCQYVHNDASTRRTVDRVLTGTCVVIVLTLLVGILVLSWYLSWRRRKDFEIWNKRNEAKKESANKLDDKQFAENAIKQTTLEVAAASAGRRPSELMNEIKNYKELEAKRRNMRTVSTSPIRETSEPFSTFDNYPDPILMPTEKSRYDSIYEVSNNDPYSKAMNQFNSQIENQTVPRNFSFNSSSQKSLLPHQTYVQQNKLGDMRYHQQSRVHQPLLTSDLHNAQKTFTKGLDYEMENLSGYRNPMFMNNYSNFDSSPIIYRDDKQLIQPMKYYDNNHTNPSFINTPGYHQNSRKNNPNTMSGIYVNAKCLTQSPKRMNMQYYSDHIYIDKQKSAQQQQKPFKIVSQQDALLNELLERSPKQNLNLSKSSMSTIYNKNSQL